MKTAIIYARAKMSDSIKMQGSACKEYAEKNEIQVIDVYWDLVLSSHCQPLAWNKILNIPKPEFNYIIIYDHERIGRDYMKQLKDRSNLKIKGVRIITPFDWLIDEIVLYDDKIEIYFLYTEKTDPDDCRGFVIRWLIFCFETRHYSKNELNKRVQLIPTWLLLSDSN